MYQIISHIHEQLSVNSHFLHKAPAHQGAVSPSSAISYNGAETPFVDSSLKRVTECIPELALEDLGLRDVVLTLLFLNGNGAEGFRCEI